jgi:hypothetical protein
VTIPNRPHESFVFGAELAHHHDQSNSGTAGSELKAFPGHTSST